MWREAAAALTRARSYVQCVALWASPLDDNDILWPGQQGCKEEAKIFICLFIFPTNIIRCDVSASPRYFAEQERSFFFFEKTCIYSTREKNRTSTKNTYRHRSPKPNQSNSNTAEPPHNAPPPPTTSYAGGEEKDGRTTTLDRGAP